MKLISDTANPQGPETPKHAPLASSEAAAKLSDPRSFLQGPPFELMAQLRREAPVAWCPPNRPGDGGFWALTRYQDVMAVNGDPERFSSQRGGILITNGMPGTEAA